jgi:hypothetical protein
MPKHDRVVLMANAQGRVGYYDDGGPVDLKDVMRRHCEQKQKHSRSRLTRTLPPKFSVFAALLPHAVSWIEGGSRLTRQARSISSISSPAGIYRQWQPPSNLDGLMNAGAILSSAVRWGQADASSEMQRRTEVRPRQ